MNGEDPGRKRMVYKGVRCLVLVLAAVVLIKSDLIAQPGLCLNCQTLEAACVTELGTPATVICGQGLATVTCIGAVNQGAFVTDCLAQGGTPVQLLAGEACLKVCP